MIRAATLALLLAAGAAQAETFEGLWLTRIKSQPYPGIATEFDDRIGSDGRELHPYRNRYCAHLTEPLGQRLRVTNRANGKSVVCEVRDRGPNRRFWPRREIDLTPPANRAIDCQGMCLVDIEREPR